MRHQLSESEMPISKKRHVALAAISPQRAHVFDCQTCQTAKRDWPRALGRAWGLPVSFLSPHEGSDAPRRRMAWISPDRPVFHGRARIAGTLTHMTRASASSRRATRHLSAFAFTASRTGPRSLVPRGGFPSAARGRGLRVPRSRVPHPAPPSRRLATTPLSERDIGTIVRSADKSTVIFHPWTI